MGINETYGQAIRAAIAASEKIMAFYTSSFRSEFKADGSPVTEADLASSECIREILEATNIPVIDEESEEIPYGTRKTWKQCWCVDPLDGTKEFIKKNGEFAVNIALIEDHIPVFGLIASPVQQEIIVGSKEMGVYIFNFDQENDPSAWRKIHPEEKRPVKLNIITSRTHYSGEILQFVNSVESRFGSFGSIQKGSSLKFFDLAENRASIYPRFAPTMEWDIASGQAILEALGGSVLDIKTYTPLRYNKPALLNPHFVGLTQAYLHEFQA